VEERCSCYTCRTFSRGYLRHLVIAREILALHLATLHNLHFMFDTMREMRDAIVRGRFADLKEEFLARYQVADYEAGTRDRHRWLGKLRTSEGVLDG
jgi:queuine tRNA-ribosyltransferase